MTYHNMTTELFKMNAGSVRGPYFLRCESGLWLYDYPFRRLWMRMRDNYTYSFSDKLIPIHISDLPEELSDLPKILWMFNSQLSWVVVSDANAHTGTHYLKMPEAS